MNRAGITPITTLQEQRIQRNEEYRNSIRAMKRAAIDHSELLLTGEELQGFVIAESIRVLGEGPG